MRRHHQANETKASIALAPILKVSKATPCSSVQASYRTSIRMSSPNPSQASDSKPQTCGLCGAGLGNSSHLARHKASVHGHTYYPCTVSGCDFATSRQDSLNSQYVSRPFDMGSS